MQPLCARAMAPKVTIKKSIINKVKELNGKGRLRSELRLGGVAAALSKISEEDALIVLGSLHTANQEGSVDDPTEWVKQEAKRVLENPDLEVEVEDEWNDEEEEDEEEEAEPAPAKTKRQPSRTAAAAPQVGKPGDWECPNCGDINFARNESCRICSEPRPGKGKRKGKLQQTTAGFPEAREGDWICPQCDDLQFASRTNCRQCGNPKPKGSTKGAKTKSKGSTKGAGKAHPGMKPGDWYCDTCDDVVFASRATCRLCGGERPEEDGTKAHRKAPAEMKPGDWLCPKCGDLQFASRQECRQCRTARPDEEEDEDQGEEEEEEEPAPPPKKRVKAKVGA